MREDWVEVISGDILDVRDGTHDTPKYVNDSEYPLVTSKNLKNHIIDFSDIKYISKDDYIEINKRSKVDIGDVLFAMIGTIGNPVVVRKEPNYSIKNIGLFKNKLRIIKSELLKYYLESFTFFDQLEKRQLLKGTTQKFIPLGHLRNIVLPIPPLSIQRSIVLKIENLFTSLDQGIADLKKAQEQLKVYRQAVLKKAFEGALTKKWRKKQTNLPTIKELNVTIEEGRRKFFDQQMHDWEKAFVLWEQNGKIEKKPSKPSKLIVPDLPNAEHEYRKWAIPEQWIWTQLGTICFVTKLAGFEYTDYVKYSDDGDLIVLKAENAGLNGFKKTEFSKIKSETVKMLSRSFLFGGELLVVFVGAGTGNVAVVPKDRQYFLGPNIGMARPYFEMNSRFLEFLLQSSIGKNMMMATAKAVAQPSLSMATIRQTPVIFPSLAEQHQIVREIESRLSVCDKVEQNITEALEKAEALRQSILKKAFEGKLLSKAEIAKCKQEADYEPAAKLLERIKNNKMK